MSFFKNLFRGGGDHPAGTARPAASGSIQSPELAKCWRRVLVPAIGQPYSGRSLEVACRLARTTSATVHLAYVVEVPRSLVLEASMPDDEAVAAQVLHDGEEIVHLHKVAVVSTVYRTRNAADGMLKLIKEAECDLLVLGARPDEMRGLPRDLTRHLFQAATCEVVLDFIAGEQ